MKFLIILSILLFASYLQQTQFEVIPAEQKKNEENLINRNSDTFQDERNFIVEDRFIPVIKPSNLIFELRKKKKENPNLTANELADFGNEFLKKYGYDYSFDWEPKGKENEAGLLREDDRDFYPFKFVFTDTSGKRLPFQLLNKSFGHPCFSAIDIPITRITDQAMTVIAEGRAFSLKRPKEFYSEEFRLVDKTLRNTIRKWKVPIDAYPLGISPDGKRIYFATWEFDQDETDNYKESKLGLAVEVSENGILKLVDLKVIKSGEGFHLGYDKKNNEIAFNRFKIGNREFIISAPSICS